MGGSTPQPPRQFEHWNSTTIVEKSPSASYPPMGIGASFWWRDAVLVYILKFMKTKVCELCSYMCNHLLGFQRLFWNIKNGESGCERVDCLLSMLMSCWIYQFTRLDVLDCISTLCIDLKSLPLQSVIIHSPFDIWLADQQGCRHEVGKVGKRPPWKQIGWALPTLEICLTDHFDGPFWWSILTA